MRFISTRGHTRPHSFSEAVAVGLAPDGGLFLPESLPDLRGRLAEWEGLEYADLCHAFFRVFATDIPEDELLGMVDSAYSRFSVPEIAPLRRLDRGIHVLELFHGPTLAFKDFALQLVGELYARQVARTGQAINVLGATSGDTGAAAIHGLLGKPGVNIFILYPNGRVSALQERQMTCTGAENVFPLAIDGSFDDAQHALKSVFGHEPFRTEFKLSAVNSINLARVLAQCVYYLFAWFRLPASERESVEFVVPTGNFGNVLAGWLARRMGLPARGFRVATNQNDILYRFFTSGHYRVGAVRPSLAPSMDIQVASNFERYLYYAEGERPERVRQVMETMRTTGEYRSPQFDAGAFRASRTDDDGIRRIISNVYENHGYVIDPHTACGFSELNPSATSVVLATASPAKFPETIREAIGIEPTDPSLERLKVLPVKKYPVEATVDGIEEFIRNHS